MCTAYNKDSCESLGPVEIFRTDDRHRFHIWKPAKNSLRLKIQNTSAQNIAFLLQQEFSDGRGYELDETVDLAAGDGVVV